MWDKRRAGSVDALYGSDKKVSFPTGSRAALMIKTYLIQSTLPCNARTYCQAGQSPAGAKAESRAMLTTCIPVPFWGMTSTLVDTKRGKVGKYGQKKLNRG